MTRFFVAPDGNDDPTIWERTDGDPVPVIRRWDLPGGPYEGLLWDTLVAGLTGTLSENNPAMVQQVARCIYDSADWDEDPARISWDERSDDIQEYWRRYARAALAAMHAAAGTGSPDEASWSPPEAGEQP